MGGFITQSHSRGVEACLPSPHLHLSRKTQGLQGSRLGLNSAWPWPGSVISASANSAWCLSFLLCPLVPLEFGDLNTYGLHLLGIYTHFLSGGVCPGWPPIPLFLPSPCPSHSGSLWLASCESNNRPAVFAFPSLTSPSKHSRRGQSKQDLQDLARKSRTKEGFFYQLFPLSKINWKSDSLNNWNPRETSYTVHYCDETEALIYFSLNTQWL